LGAERQRQIKRSCEVWRAHPTPPSTCLWKAHETKPICSARVDLDWRSLGVMENDTVIWFWVGPHDEYEALLRRF